jgi:NodT family efflux transporter outer membrane factor (OMF) lipoprotein
VGNATHPDNIDEDWWQAFNDRALDNLERRATTANQSLVAAEAAVRSAGAFVNQQQAAFFPTITAGGSRESGDQRFNSNTRNVQGNGSHIYTATGEATWEPDLWGAVRRNVENARDLATASEADLAGARLSVQADVATDYFQLRSLDLEVRLVSDTVLAYEVALRITQNRYAAGAAARSDVLQAETQLFNARADLAALRQQRAQLEHALAVLVGEAVAQFDLEPVENPLPDIPDVGAGIPSALLERRPDIAATERRAAAANATIGAQHALYFPSITLDGSYSFAATAANALFDPGAGAKSVVLSIAETLFDGGARHARVAQAQADWDQAQAQYRQTVLAAFQDVEDQLVAVRQLTEQSALLRQSSQAADLAERISINQYKAGQISYTDVVVAQTTALTARRALVTAEQERISAAISLVRALGGGWKQ